MSHDSDVILLKDDFAIILVHKTTGGVPFLPDPASLRDAACLRDTAYEMPRVRGCDRGSTIRVS